jgi:hypothetical protein
MKITDPYSPTIEPSNFTTKIDNPYFPLTPGTRTIYEATTQDGLQRTTTEVTRDTKNIMGVDTVVVHDTVTIDNEVFEDTLVCAGPGRQRVVLRRSHKGIQGRLRGHGGLI